MATLNDYDLSNGAENIPIYCFDGCPTEKLVHYVCCNIPGPGTETNNFEEKIQGCTCEGETCDMSHATTCTCMGFGPAYNEDGKLLFPGDDNSMTVLLECNSLCKCSTSCINRVVQNGIQKRLRLFYDNDKGFGIKTLDSIECGTFVCEYSGEILNEQEAKQRAKSQQMKNDMNYIFVLREHVASGVLVTYIDPSNIGNVGRFINHSCEPNLCIRPARIHNLVPKVCFYALRDISAYEELTYSYGSSDLSLAALGDEKCKICLCGSKTCAGYLPCDKFILGE